MERAISEAFEKTGRFFGQTATRRFMQHERHQAQKFDVSTSGLENIEAVAARPFIVAANHLEPEGMARQLLGGSADSFVFENVLNPRLPQPITSVANGDFMFWLSKNKLARRGQRILEKALTGNLEGTGDVITAKLNPGSINVEFVRKIKDAIAHNRSILMFPEGTWYKDWDETHDLKQGTAYIAKMFGLPVVPAYIHGANSWKRGTQVKVSFGEAIDHEGKTKEEITAQIRQGITSLQLASRP